MNFYSKWHLVFTLLSTKRLNPIWKYLDLDLKINSTTNKVAQEFVKKYRSIENSEDISNGNRLESFQILLDYTKNLLDQSIRKGYSHILEEWSKMIFEDDFLSHNSGFIWLRIFRQLTKFKNKSFQTIPLKLDQNQEKLLPTILEEKFAAREILRNLIKELESSSSDNREQKLIEHYIEGGNLNDWIIEIYNNLIFEKILSELNAQFSDSSKLILLEWAKAQAEEMKMPPILITPI